jgi:hydroxymethylpyrimidine pyrophosphatase-like HAD family hydrolase
MAALFQFAPELLGHVSNKVALALWSAAACLCIVLDYDGTVVIPGGMLTKAMMEFYGRQRRFVFVTAQAWAYMQPHVQDARFGNRIYTDKGAVYYEQGDIIVVLEAEAYGNYLAALRNFMSVNLLEFAINEKHIGFAADLTEHDTVVYERVKEFLIGVAATTGGKFVVEPTAGFVDFAMASVSKKDAVLHVKRENPGCMILAGGDSPITDGPMMEEADFPLAVGSKNFGSIEQHKHFIRLPNVDLVFSLVRAIGMMARSKP